MAIATPEIVIDISPIGDVKIDAKNFTGKACQKATQEIEIALGGGGMVKRKDKPEAFAPAISGNNRSKLTF